MLRNEDPDWNVMGPQPPATKAPWTTNPSYSTQPLLPPAELTVPLTNHGGGPYGLTTQPEYFLNDVVFDSSGRIVAGNGTGQLDIVGNLYVNLDASFNQNVFIRNQLRVFDNTKIDNQLTVGQDSTLNGNVFLNNTSGNTTIDGVTFIKNQLQVGESIRPLKIAAPYYDDYLLHIDAKTPFGAFTPSLLIEGPHSSISDPSLNSTQQLSIDASGGVKFLTDIDMSLNDISNVKILDASSVLANEFFQKMSKSSILDFSSIEINIGTTLGWYDVASILPTSQDISANKSTQASALVEIYLVMYDTTGYSPTTDYLEYLKCEISEFRGNSASINVLSAANIPNGNTAKILDRLRILYGNNTLLTSAYYDPGALFQIGLKDSYSTGTKQQKLFYRIYQNNPIDLLIPSGPPAAILTGQWQISLSNNPNNSPKWKDETSTHRDYETTYTIKLDFNPNAGSTGGIGVVNGGGKLMYVNDKDTKFTSNVKFEEAIIGDISFNHNVDISGNLDVTGDISGTDLTIDNIKVRTAYGAENNIFGTDSISTYDPSGLVVKNTNDSLFVSNGWNYVLGGEKVILTSGTVIRRTDDLNIRPHIQIYPGASGSDPSIQIHTINKPLLLDTSGSTVKIKVNSNMVMQFHENYNENMVGNTLFTPTTTDVSGIVVGSSIPTGTGYINNRIGHSVVDIDGDAQVVNQGVPSYWLESGWNVSPKYAKQLVLMGSEMKFDIYNAYPIADWSGATSFGAFEKWTDYTSSGTNTFRVWDSSWNSVTAMLGAMTSLYRRTNQAGNLLPVHDTPDIKMPRDGWITGIHLHQGFAINDLDYLFELDGLAELQLIATGVGRKENSGGNLVHNDTIIIDTCTSANINSKLSGGWSIELEPKKWIYVAKGKNLHYIFRLKLFCGSSSGTFTSANQARVRYGSVIDGGSYSTNWSVSAVQGFFTVWCPPRDASVDKNY
jgi:hypothetical protein